MQSEDSVWTPQYRDNHKQQEVDIDHSDLPIKKETFRSKSQFVLYFEVVITNNLNSTANKHF